MNLNEEFRKFREELMLKNNISCSNCEFFGKDREGECASKIYCILKDNCFPYNYKPRRTTFRKDWRVFFCPSCGKTFTVSDAEYQLAYEKYVASVEESKKILQERGVFLVARFELKGHAEWIYRPDEDYTEEVKKYESTHSKS